MGLTLALLDRELEARPVFIAKPSSQPRREGQPGGRGEGAEDCRSMPLELSLWSDTEKQLRTALYGLWHMVVRHQYFSEKLG